MLQELQKDQREKERNLNKLKLVKENGAENINQVSEKRSEKDRILKDINNRAQQLSDKYKYKAEVGVKDLKEYVKPYPSNYKPSGSPVINQYRPSSKASECRSDSPSSVHDRLYMNHRRPSSREDQNSKL